jgi:RNA-directed DNA polymerase
MKRELPVRFCEGLGVQLPRATRLVICCRGSAVPALHAMRSMMERLRLTVNERKTRICRVPGDTFQFLGYTFGSCYSARRHRSYLGMRPSAKAVQRICRAISAMTSRRWTYLPEDEMVRCLNQRLAGWANYFQLGSVDKAYHAVDRHTAYRRRKWLRWKHRLGARGLAQFSYPYLYQTLGLIRLPLLPRFFPWATT